MSYVRRFGFAAPLFFLTFFKRADVAPADAGARVFGLALPISEASSADKSR